MIKIYGEPSPLEKYMMQGISNPKSNNVKFHNVTFSAANTIEDKEGNVFKRVQWKPVSIPPEKDGEYLVTCYMQSACSPYCAIAFFAKDLYQVDQNNFYDKQGKCGWYSYDRQYGYYEKSTVIAWMPLPELYSE